MLEIDYWRAGLRINLFTFWNKILCTVLSHTIHRESIHSISNNEPSLPSLKRIAILTTYICSIPFRSGNVRRKVCPLSILLDDYGYGHCTNCYDNDYFTTASWRLPFHVSPPHFRRGSLRKWCSTADQVLEFISDSVPKSNPMILEERGKHSLHKMRSLFQIIMRKMETVQICCAR